MRAQNMINTYKFYDKAEDAKPIDTMVFEGSEEEIREQVHEYCDIYGYEAFTLIESKPKEAKAPEKRVWSEQEIKDLIQTNDKVLYGALKKLYAEQTADEQRAHETRNRNNAGFNSVDAQFLSSVAEFLNKTGFLTDKQKVITRKKLVKYNKQLTRLANA